MLGASALGQPRGMVWGGKREEGCSGWGTHVYLWWIHCDIWQNEYNFVKFKNKIKFKKKSKKKIPQTGWFKQQELVGFCFCFLTAWRLEVQDQGAGRAGFH